MKKKLIVAMLTASMVVASLTACGGSTASTATTSKAATSTATTSTAASTATTSTASKAATSTATTSKATDSTSSGATLKLNMDDMMSGTQFEGLKAKDKYSFQIVVKAFQNTYWQAVISGVNAAAKELGVTVNAQGPNNESDIADQVNMLNTAINNGPAGVGLSACDASSVIDSLNNAKTKKIPIVAFDTAISGAPKGTLTATIATDSIAAGAEGAKHMWEAIGSKVKSASGTSRVGMVAQDATSTNHQQRGVGFIDGLIEAATADGIKVAVTGNDYFVGACKDKGDEASAKLIIECAVPAQSTLDLAATEASAIMNKSDCVGMYGTGQTATEGLLSANDNLDKFGTDASKNVIAVGFDSGTILKEAISAGTMYGCITQMPYAMGYYTVCALTAAANGDTVKDMAIPGYFYNKDNIDDPLIAPNLYD